MQEDILEINHERYFRYLFLIMFFAYPVSSYVTDFLGIGTGIISILTRAFQVFCAGLYFLFLSIHKRFKVSHFQLLLFFIFWCIYAIRIVYDTSVNERQLAFPNYQYYLFGIVLSFFCAIPFFAAVPVNERRLEVQVLILSFLLTILALYNTLSSGELFVERMGGNERLNPITTGVIATFPILISLKRIFFSKNNLIQVLLYVTCIIICLTALLIVSTKVMFICIAFNLGLMLAYLVRKGRIKALTGVVVFFAIAVVVVLYGGFADYFALSLLRFTEIGQDESSQIRINLIHGAVNQFVESPVLGSFLEERTQKFYPHNMVLESFMALGVIGGALFLAFYIIYFIQTVVLVLKTAFGTAGFVATAYCLMALTSGSLSFSPEFWYSAAMVSWMVTARPKFSFSFEDIPTGHDYYLQK